MIKKKKHYVNTSHGLEAVFLLTKSKFDYYYSKNIKVFKFMILLFSIYVMVFYFDLIYLVGPTSEINF